MDRKTSKGVFIPLTDLPVQRDVLKHGHCAQMIPLVDRKASRPKALHIRERRQRVGQVKAQKQRQQKGKVKHRNRGTTRVQYRSRGSTRGTVQKQGYSTDAEAAEGEQRKQQRVR